MKKYGKILLMCFLLLQFGCSEKQKIQEYDMMPFLKARSLSAGKSTEAIKLNFCKETPFKWNNIIILPPYSNEEILKKQNLTNFQEIKKMLPELTLDEGKCVLLFTENNHVVRYSFVSRTPLDFNNLVRSEKPLFKISYEMMCNRIYIKKENNTLVLSY